MERWLDTLQTNVTLSQEYPHLKLEHIDVY